MKGFNWIFWGFLFVMIDFHVVIDILPNSIGYFFIFFGIRLISKTITNQRNRHSTISMFQIIFSIPTIFISSTALEQSGVIPSLWPVYFSFLALIDLILIYSMFQMMLDIAHKFSQEELYSSTQNLARLLISFILVHLLLQPFALNLMNGVLLTAIVFLNIMILVLMITFLVHLRKYAKLNPNLNIPM